MIDSHCHLDHEPLLSNLSNVIQRSKEVGIEKLLTISTSFESFSKVKELVNKDEMIYGTIGIHPHESSTNIITSKQIIESLNENSKIIGAGGINYFTEQKVARISWDMIDPRYQGNGIGKKLTKYRINHLNSNSKIESIIVRTTQLVYKFYEKLGFELEKVEKDFWAKDFDLYQMKMNNKN